MAFLLLSCLDHRREPTEAELSAFGKYVYELDTLEIEQSKSQILNADTSLWDVDKAVRKEYVTHHLKTLWFTRMGVSSEADSLLTNLRDELPRNGLDSNAFYIPQIANDLNIVHSLAFDSLGLNINEVLARLDYNLTKAYIRYTTGQRFGFTRPDKLLNHLDRKPDSGYARLFDFTFENVDCRQAMQALNSNQRIAFLLTSTPQSSIAHVLQEQMTRTTDAKQRLILAINIERCRWKNSQPESKGRRILVNIPAQQLWAISPDTVIDKRICCGATPTKTPLLHSAITHLEVNPAWIIPQTIIKAEVAAHAGDSAYFARHRYSIINTSTGAALNPTNVTAQQLQSGSIRISQQGGTGNSLGRIVFRFPNSFSVYLHDTSNRSAFQRERRTLSHGCVRVQKPFELANFIMPDADEWHLDRLRLSMDIPPTTDRGRKYLREHADDPRPLRLITYQKISPNVPVDIIYFTAYPNPATGTIEFWPDLYGYDALLARTLPIQQ